MSSLELISKNLNFGEKSSEFCAESILFSKMISTSFSFTLKSILLANGVKPIVIWWYDSSSGSSLGILYCQ